MARVAGHWDPPGEVQPGDREIAQPLVNKIFHLLLASGRQDETRPLDQGLYLGLIAGEPEEEIDLVAPFQGFAVNAAFRVLAARGVVLELLTGDAIPALLAPLHHIAICLHPGKELPHQLLMLGAGGADEAVVTDLPAAPEIAVAGADGIAVGLGTEPGGFSGALDLLAVLIAAGDEHNLLPSQALKASDRIARQRGVRAA